MYTKQLVIKIENHLPIYTMSWGNKDAGENTIKCNSEWRQGGLMGTFCATGVGDLRIWHLPQ